MSSLWAKLQRDRLAAEHAKLVARALRESGENMPARSTRAAAGDPDALRGIPVVGVRGGRGGAIRGTQPGAGLR